MNVLLAEPDPDFARVLTTTLERDGCVVLRAGDGDGVLWVARQGVSLVLLSPALPGGPVARVLQGLSGLGVPTLVIMPVPDEAVHSSAVRAGAREVWVRPFPLFEIGGAVRRHGRPAVEGGATPSPSRTGHDRDTVRHPIPTDRQSVERPLSTPIAGQDRASLHPADRVGAMPRGGQDRGSLPPPERFGATPRVGQDRGTLPPPERFGATPRGGQDRGTLPPPEHSGATPRCGQDRGSLPPPEHFGATPRGGQDRGSLPPPEHFGATPRGGQDRGSLPPPERFGVTPRGGQDRGTLPPPEYFGATPRGGQDRGSLPPPEYFGATPRGGEDRASLPPPERFGATPRGGQDRGSLPPPEHFGATPRSGQDRGTLPPPEHFGATPRSGQDRGTLPPPEQPGARPRPVDERVGLPGLGRVFEERAPALGDDRPSLGGSRLERAGVSTSAPRADRINLGIFARLWARQASGYVVIDDVARAPLYRGAPVGPEALALVERGLRGGMVRLDPASVPGPSDREAFGRSLWRHAEAAAGPADRQIVADSVLFPSVTLESIVGLPLDGPARIAFGHLQTRSTLVRLVDQTGQEIADVIGGLAVLFVLGLLVAEQPRLRSDVTRRLEKAPISTVSTVAARDALARSVSDVRTQGTGSAEGAWSDVMSASQADPQRSVGRQGVGAALRTAAASMSNASGPSAMRTSALRNNLRREVALFRDSTPWTVLGVPPATPPDKLEQAGLRMLQRYDQLRAHPDEEVAQLADAIFARVQAAVRQTAAAAVPLPPEVAVAEIGPDEPFYRQGLDALNRGDFALADKFFGRARDLVSDSPRNLAYLGWARFNNPNVAAATREQDGLALIQVSEQFNNRYIDAQMFLVTIHLRRGEEAIALRRARRVLKLEPSHPDAASLVRRLSTKLSQG